MKILWMTNYPLPQIAKRIGLPVTVNEGWLVEVSERLISLGYDLIFCTIVASKGKLITWKDSNVTFYGIPNMNEGIYDAHLQETLSSILRREMPDIVHIMGTEFPHSYSMWEACKQTNMMHRCVVSIQGLVSKIAQVYNEGIENEYQKRRLVWDFVIGDSILCNKKKFEKRGIYERKLLSEVTNVIGRTKWDYMCARQINPTMTYYVCNETLRKPFYEGKWSYENCEKHSIIISQATYPIKGFHILLKAAAILRAKYHDLKIYVPSRTMYPLAMKRNSLLNSDYVNYIVKLIKNNKLQDNIVFLGSLDAEKMCETYLKSNVFVCPSCIENSSNSLGEAMLLGMPIVAAYVGGMPSMMSHEKEGLFYPYIEEYTLAGNIDYLFQNSNEAIQYGTNARIRAHVTHNAERNIETLLNCYEDIKGKNEYH